MKVTIEFSDGSKWEINPETVIKHRDMYKKDSKTLFESDHYEMVDWIEGKMDWSELDAVMVNKPNPVEYSVLDGAIVVDGEE
ncbi:MAG: hypothetical protein GY787_10225 [Alteromonadales bacterium]|nr:hypothetical protein [Alteromonadales bacterium]